MQENQTDTGRRSSGFMEETLFLLEVVEDIERAYSGDYSSAYDIFCADEFSQCFEPGRVIVLCGNNTAFNRRFIALLVNHLLFQKLRTCAVFSLNSKEFARMQLSILSGISVEKLLTGGLLDDDWSCLTRALGKLNEAPLYLENMHELHLVSSIRGYVSRCADQTDGSRRCPALIDGLQIDECEMAGLKNLAVELQLPVFITCDDAALQIEQADVLLTLTSYEPTAGQFWNCIFSMHYNGRALIEATEIRVGR